MRRLARAERICRRCPFRTPSGQCLERTLKSGRCGDWIWWVHNGKQSRRLYIHPHDPRSPAQVRSSARFGATSRKYSYSPTEKQRAATIKAGTKRKTRPRLHQSGPLTGQQHSIRKEYALQNAHGKGIKSAYAPQAPQPQMVNPTSWDPRRGASGVSPYPRRSTSDRRSEVLRRDSRGAPVGLREYQRADWARRAFGRKERRTAPALESTSK